MLATTRMSALTHSLLFDPMHWSDSFEHQTVCTLALLCGQLFFFKKSCSVAGDEKTENYRFFTFRQEQAGPSNFAAITVGSRADLDSDSSLQYEAIITGKGGREGVSFVNHLKTPEIKGKKVRPI